MQIEDFIPPASQRIACSTFLCIQYRLEKKLCNTLLIETQYQFGSALFALPHSEIQSDICICVMKWTLVPTTTFDFVVNCSSFVVIVIFSVNSSFVASSSEV